MDGRGPLEPELNPGSRELRRGPTLSSSTRSAHSHSPGTRGPRAGPPGWAEPYPEEGGLAWPRAHQESVSKGTTGSLPTPAGEGSREAWGAPPHSRRVDVWPWEAWGAPPHSGRVDVYSQQRLPWPDQGAVRRPSAEEKISRSHTVWKHL